jgi:dihydrodipicolinate synthase/N-acetylneuraminate lyase
MAAEPMRGVYPILQTPFDTQGRLDEESLQRLVEFEIQAGVHGLGVALGSECFRLSEAERARMTRLIADQARGRVPVVINTSAPGTDLAVLYSQQAADNGADALMLTPPIPLGMGGAGTPADIRAYFRAVSDAVPLPIFIQSQGANPVSPALAQQIAAECEHVRYLKEEAPPAAQRVGEAVRAAGDVLTVFGGAVGTYFIEELRRGAQGTMPGCSHPEVFVRMWDLFHAGDEEAAIAEHAYVQRFARVSALLRDGFFHLHKELLRQRGIIATTVIRAPAAPFPDDPLLRREVQEVIDEYIAHVS